MVKLSSVQTLLSNFNTWAYWGNPFARSSRLVRPRFHCVNFGEFDALHVCCNKFRNCLSLLNLLGVMNRQLLYMVV